MKPHARLMQALQDIDAQVKATVAENKKKAWLRKQPGSVKRGIESGRLIVVPTFGSFAAVRPEPVAIARV